MMGFSRKLRWTSPPPPDWSTTPIRIISNSIVSVDGSVEEPDNINVVVKLLIHSDSWTPAKCYLFGKTITWLYENKQSVDRQGANNIIMCGWDVVG